MKILFLADKFDDEPRDDVSNFPGGAELTDAALIESCPWEIKKIKNQDILPEMLKDFDVHIVGNFKSRDKKIIKILNELGRHILFEHDMRICRYDGDFLRARKEPVHYFTHRCICPHLNLRGLYKSGLGTIFLTNRQLSVYKRNPFFKAKNIEVLGSSAMNSSFFKRVDDLKKKKNKNKKGTAVFYSPHPVKGYKESKDYCIGKGVNPIEIFDKTPDEVFNIFERSENFVYLPIGMEWAGRMPVEARFLGCKVVINDNVGVAGESWWDLSDDPAYKFLKDTPDRFWRIVEKLVNENSG